jgi:hypothetical protein
MTSPAAVWRLVNCKKQMMNYNSSSSSSSSSQSDLLYLLTVGIEGYCCICSHSMTHTHIHTHTHTYTHTYIHTHTFSKVPLDEGSARRRDIYLYQTPNTHNRQTSMPPAGSEPTNAVTEWQHTSALQCAATAIGVELFMQTQLMI